MGNHVADVVEYLPSARTIKVHARMCLELSTLLTRISKIFPEIEAARPRCSSGIGALCLLNSGIDKAKSLLQHCSESSVLYLALTGEAILSRCKKSRNILEQSLSQIQNMVPVILAAKISGIVADLRNVAFCLDPSEEEAGKILRELLHKYGSTINSREEYALAAISTVSFRLHISSQKALLIEKRSIKKLLDKFGDTDPAKRKILAFFLNLMNKYGKSISKEQRDTISSDHHKDRILVTNPYHLSGEVELRMNYRCNEAQIDMLSQPVPPEEFICPLSLRLMYDPVLIASGETYEKMWIQKWFDEGHDTCPKTNMKLPNLSFTSNNSMKDLIMKWCATCSVSNPDLKVQFQHPHINSWDTSINSIASLSSSMNDLDLPLEFSNVSLRSSRSSDLSYGKMSSSCEIDMEFLSKFSTLPWDSRCNAVEDVKRLLEHDDESWPVISSGKFIQVIVQFLKDAKDIHDVEAQMTGCLLLFEFVQKQGTSFAAIQDDAYDLLASFLHTEMSKQVLPILEALSSHKQCGYKIASSSALIGIMNILDSQKQELLDPAIKILTNLSSDSEISWSIVPSEFIPKLIPLFDDDSLARYCTTILKNMCDNGNVRTSIAETDGCIASIAKLLEKDNAEVQENAVSVLVSLCYHRVEYCQLVMDEGVIPGLVSVTSNGNRRAKAMAMELLRILKDEVHAGGQNSGPEVRIDDNEVPTGENPPRMEICIDDKGPQRGENRPKSKSMFGKFFSKKK